MNANLQKLATAQENLASWQARWDNYEGNNPNKYRSDIQHAQAEVARLTKACKDAGLIELTEQEQLWKELDARYPDTQSRAIVNRDGQFFQKIFTPTGKSNSGATVLGWDSSWVELAADSAMVTEFLQRSTQAEHVFAAQHEFCKAWPFPVPGGGLVLLLKEGEPAVQASTKKTAVSYQKGRPVLRTQLVVELTATREAMERLLALPVTSVAKFDYLGKTASGKEAFLRKKGAGSKGLYVEEC